MVHLQISLEIQAKFISVDPLKFSGKFQAYLFVNPLMNSFIRRFGEGIYGICKKFPDFFPRLLMLEKLQRRFPRLLS